MTQLAIINVAYDADADAVIGILEEYFMNTGETLDETKLGPCWTGPISS